MVWVTVTQELLDEFGLQQKTIEQLPPEDLEPPVEESEASSCEASTSKDAKWSIEATLYLIDKVNKHDEELSQNFKRPIWEKISQLCQAKFNSSFYTHVRCETKWKALKRTYKAICLHNKETGQKRRYWQYFDAMHKILYKKPEINPIATCSSLDGLQVACG